MAGPVVCTPEISIEKFNAGFPITGPLELVKLNTIQDCVALAGVMVSETCSPLIVVGVPSVAVVAAKSVGKLVPLTPECAAQREHRIGSAVCRPGHQRHGSSGKQEQFVARYQRDATFPSCFGSRSL